MTIEKRLLDEAIKYGREMEKERDRMVETMVQMQDRLTELERHCERVANVVTGNKNPHGQDEQAMQGQPQTMSRSPELECVELLQRLFNKDQIEPSKMEEVERTLRRVRKNPLRS